MENALLVGLSRLTALERQFDVVANNIATSTNHRLQVVEPIFQEVPVIRRAGKPLCGRPMPACASSRTARRSSISARVRSNDRQSARHRA